MGGKQKGRKASNKVANDIPPEDNYEVEKIVDSRVIKGKLQYKVHWVGYTSEEDTWENESQLDCPEVLEEYIASQNEESSNTAKKQEKPNAKTKGSAEVLGAEGTKYEVEKIVGDRLLNGKKQFKIHWLGYGTDDETWENESEVDCPDLVKKYLKESSRSVEEKKTPKKKSKPEFRREESDSESSDYENLKGSDDNRKPLRKKSKSDNQNEETGDENECENSKGSEDNRKPLRKKSKSDNQQNEEIEDDNEYEVERILEMHTLKDGKREFLVKWVGFSKKESTWEPEVHLQGTEVLEKFLQRVEKAKELSAKELRVNRKPTDYFTSMPQGHLRRQSRRHANKQRVKYYDAE